MGLEQGALLGERGVDISKGTRAAGHAPAGDEHGVESALGLALGEGDPELREGLFAEAHGELPRACERVAPAIGIRGGVGQPAPLQQNADARPRVGASDQLLCLCEDGLGVGEAALQPQGPGDLAQGLGPEVRITIKRRVVEERDEASHARLWVGEVPLGVEHVDRPIGVAGRDGRG